MTEKYKKVIADKRSQAERLMNGDQLTKCNIAIHTASIASAAAGVVPFPVADAVPITIAQITMVVSLGSIFDTKVSESVAKGLIGAAASTFVGRNIVKLIPIIGWGVSAAVAAGVTEAIGWTIAVDFAKDAKLRWEIEHKIAEENHQKDASFTESSKSTAHEDGDTENRGNFSIEELVKKSEEFLSGEKKYSQHKDEFSTLLSEIEKVLDSLPYDHSLRELYDKLNLGAAMADD